MRSSQEDRKHVSDPDCPFWTHSLTRSSKEDSLWVWNSAGRSSPWRGRPSGTGDHGIDKMTQEPAVNSRPTVCSALWCLNVPHTRVPSYQLPGLCLGGSGCTWTLTVKLLFINQTRRREISWKSLRVLKTKTQQLCGTTHRLVRSEAKGRRTRDAAEAGDRML